jgi:hypothetical protein
MNSMSRVRVQNACKSLAVKKPCVHVFNGVSSVDLSPLCTANANVRNFVYLITRKSYKSVTKQPFSHNNIHL